MPSRRRSGSRPTFIFKDARGRYVSDQERYTKAKFVYVLRGNRYVRLSSEGVRPDDWAQLLRGAGKSANRAREDYEKLPPLYGHPEKLSLPRRRNAAWAASLVLAQKRALRGQLVEYTIRVKDGKRTRLLRFVHQFGARAKFTDAAGSLWWRIKQSVEDLAGRSNRDSKQINFTSRTGKKLSLDGITYREITV